MINCDVFFSNRGVPRNGRPVRGGPQSRCPVDHGDSTPCRFASRETKALQSARNLPVYGNVGEPIDDWIRNVAVVRACEADGSQDFSQVVLRGGNSSRGPGNNGGNSGPLYSCRSRDKHSSTVAPLQTLESVDANRVNTLANCTGQRGCDLLRMVYSAVPLESVSII